MCLQTEIGPSVNILYLWMQVWRRSSAWKCRINARWSAFFVFEAVDVFSLADRQDKLLKRRVAGLRTYVLTCMLACASFIRDHLDTATIKPSSTYRYREALRHDTHSYDNSNNKTHNKINN